MTNWIEIKAGEKAYQHIQTNGLQSSDIRYMLGASGGPKWFILQGLDHYLFGDFFKNRTQPLGLIGTSAGAWRFASLGQANPTEASALFSKLYRATVYSEKPTSHEITEQAIELLQAYIPANAVDSILTQNVFQHYILVARSKGLNRSSNRFLQGIGLACAAGVNLLSRTHLKHHFERVVFHHPQASPEPGFQWGTVKTRSIALNRENFSQAILATGSIPMVLDGVVDIKGAPRGVYRDGGITDYHFDFGTEQVEGLILYPHFQSSVIPGWFDKKLKRQTTGKHWKNVILVHPSEDFLKALPYQKIPDRTDFETLDPVTRQAYWQQATDLGYRMAEQFQAWVESGEIAHRIKLWS